AYIFRTYPDGSQEVLTLDLANEIALNDPIALMDNDQVRILSDRTYYDGAVLSISGEVRNAMEMPYDSTITLYEVLELAGGLTYAGDSSQVVVYRMDFQGKSIGKLREYKLDSRTFGDFTFKPFDAIIVRRKAGFEFQEYVSISGEVTFPGRYALRQGEKVSDLLRKAGGLTKDAMVSAASFNREGKGKIYISIDKIMKVGNTYNNIKMLPGDEIFIPAKDMTVEIRLANTEASEYAAFSTAYARESVNVAYVAGKSAKWYVKNMVGGYGDNAKRNKTNVVYANGTVKGFKMFRLAYRYPKVRAGSTIVVGSKQVREEKDDRELKPIDMNQVIATLAATVSSFATMYVLITR
ncbi:MAG: hypothetical protein HN408_00230, partial [Flavobacteriales bacterium]|nr:hypothetical protein [Flavobacteriales bacterium]